MSEPFVLVNLNEHYPERLPSDRRASGDGNDRRPPGPPGENPLESRVTKLETHIEYVRRDLDELRVDIREHRKETRTDFRVLFGALITAALGLAGMMGKGFGWL
ncbi:hypothetical protein NTD84_07925 [Pseudomonas sp. 14P_8.1_Bac3]|uniref:hypothetical protein n=1 Tax=Pseudomonas sp. 14P_8.1_Bac3 TaxID=2971621 RepID=UPI0021CACFD7|nr:hypothetical protein [Pseudomonas sp. 14P_8.1_Bac3]MCU1759650.1 hypothetical protein [Pseudomonas sp. 14P_8.1_Bac3]